MSVKVTGDKALERELEKHFGIKEMVKVQDKALIAGAKVIVEEIKKTTQTFRRLRSAD